MESGTGTYNIPAGVRLEGWLSTAALEQALREVVRRHEVLRTSFIETEGEPLQVIAETVGLGLDEVDLSGLEADEREAVTTKLSREESSRGFDLKKASLIRARLLRIAEQEQVLLLTMHHIVSDGWSGKLLIRETGSLYEGFTEGRLSGLRELQTQYADYAVWQREWLQGEALDRQISYWKEQLAGAPEVLDLPTDRPRPPVQTHRGAIESLVLSTTLSKQLKSLSQRNGCTMFMALLAAFKLLLSRHTGQLDIVVGAPIAGRSRSEVEEQIGLFLNTLTLRTDISGSPSFTELLNRVRKTALEAYAHQDVPFEMLLQALHPQRDLSRTPLFQVFFNMLNLPGATLELQGLKLRPISAKEADAKFDLTIYVAEQSEGLGLNLVYNTDLFDGDRIREMLNQYEYLLNQIVENPDEKVERYSLVTAQSAKVLADPVERLRTDWYGSIQSRLSEQASRIPGQIAVMDARETWTYEELNRRSNQLAHYLLNSGIRRQDVVAIYAHRSASVVWAVLGVLKAGAAFLMLDPVYPTTRLIEYLKTADARGLLQIQAAGELPSPLEEYLKEMSPACRLVLPDRTRAEKTGLLNDYSTQDPQVEVGPDDMALVAFTSGSTGTPKGIIGRHGPLTHFLPWQQTEFELGEIDRFSMVSGLAHDPLQRDIFTPLWVGARICVPDPTEFASPGWLARWMADQGVTFAHFTPAVMQLVTQTADCEIETLRYALTVGDVLTRRDVGKLKRMALRVRCVNLYGSTETQRAVGYYRIEEEERKVKASIPLGRGIEDVQVLVMNGNERLAGVGELGEIYMRSPHLAKGYLKDDEQTRAKFVVSPYTGQEEDRWYKTGDLGRYRADGNVEFAGRNDLQVKIRGYRIELGEIEAALQQYPGTREAVVIAREDDPGEKKLVAYVTTEDERLDSQEMGRFVRERLPGYMVPSAFVRIESLPKTPNGKVDRRALPKSVQSSRKEEAVSKGNWIEEVLAGIWAELLNREDISGGDDFFELGGHSLLATQMVSRVRESFKLELPLQKLFENPTLGCLAKRIEEGMQSQQELIAPAIRPVQHDRPLPLSFAQERLWFLHRLQPNSSAYNISGGVRLTGALQINALDQTISEIVRRHGTLRTIFSVIDGQPVQIIQPYSSLDLAIVDLDVLSEDDRAVCTQRLASEQSERAFDLSKGPVMRAALLSLGLVEHALLLAIHHIASDGWSNTIVVREIGSLYQTFSAGRPSVLDELAVQYADYAQWQREWLQADVLQSQLSYWKQQLRNSPPVLELPSDRPRPQIQAFRGGSDFIVIPQKLSEKLTALGRRERCTPFMTLLSVFKTLLYRYTGCKDLLVGTGIANRKSVEVESVIGFFVNQLVLRTQLSERETFRDLLHDLRDTTLGAYVHQDLPFEKLVEELQPERSLSHTPLFQVMFMMQNMPSRSLRLGDMTLRPLKMINETAKFDLTMFVIPLQEGMAVTLEYNSVLFDADRISRMLGHFQSLISAVASNPEQRLCDLPILTEQEHLQLLVEWNDTHCENSEIINVGERFSEQTKLTPDSVAVEFDGARLTYRELNSRINQLANFLRRQGVGQDVVVGVCMERSIEMIIGILGILKAGGAYLPLEPTHPEQRLSSILREAEVSIVLVQQHLAPRLPAALVESVCLDSDWPIIALEDERDLSIEASPDNLAYVIYTSGSTGRPKGVMITQRGLADYLNWSSNAYPVAEGRGAPVHSQLSFDLTITSVFPALLSGRTAFLVSEGEGIAGLISTIREQGDFSLIKITPAHMALINQMLSPKEMSGLTRALVIGGEQLEGEVLQPWVEHAPETKLINEYGPTETVVGCCIYEVPPDSLSSGPVLIGKPKANMQMHIADSNLQLLPVGVSGEVYIGGESLARGYLSRPDLTAEAFIPNCFSSKSGERLYKTGDLASYKQDGNIRFIGRRDSQIKIRGFRIEIGEIEATLVQHPAIKEAAVVVQENTVSDKRLVAYVVLEENQDIAVSSIRDFLKRSLPEYMVPPAFVPLLALPLTANGKVDRRGLPAPEAISAMPTGVSYVAPRAELERALANIWQEVLRVQSVGVEDNFFDLGGHSLLLVRVNDIIRNELGLDIPLLKMFEHPTIASLARYINSGNVEEATEGDRNSGPEDEDAIRRRRGMKKRRRTSAAAAGDTSL